MKNTGSAGATNVRVGVFVDDILKKTLYALSFDIGDTTANITAQVENIGGSDAENAIVKFRINNDLFTTKDVDVGYGQTENVSVDWQKEKGMFDVLIKVNPYHYIVESNYSNNDITSILYVCSKSRVLIVDKNDDSVIVGLCNSSITKFIFIAYDMNK